MTDDSYDLVLKGGRVIDPNQGRDEIADVGIRGGKIVRIEPGLAAGATAERELDASGKPGGSGPGRSAHPLLLGRDPARRQRRQDRPRHRRHLVGRHRHRRGRQLRGFLLPCDPALKGAHLSAAARLPRWAAGHQRAVGAAAASCLTSATRISTSCSGWGRRSATRSTASRFAPASTPPDRTA